MFAHYFDAAIDILKSMKGRLQVEFICEEVNRELVKVRLGTNSCPHENLFERYTVRCIDCFYSLRFH